MTLPRDPEGLKQTVLAALSVAPQESDPRQAVERYRYALQLIWTRVGTVVGSDGARAILEYAARIASQVQPEAALVEVGEDGPDLSKLDLQASGEEMAHLCRALRELYLATFRTIVELTGEVVARPLLEELQQHQGERETE